MEYYSSEDIAGMTNNGENQESIDSAVAINIKAEELIVIITNAFSGVTLEDGIGLDEAQAIDDYKTLDERAEKRSNDEKECWSNISFSELNRCNSSLCFFDCNGMRFYLPAYMIADIKNEFMFELMFSLTNLNDYSKSQFSSFSINQREAVRCFLNYVYECPGDSYYDESIVDALLGFWCESED